MLIIIKLLSIHPQFDVFNLIDLRRPEYEAYLRERDLCTIHISNLGQMTRMLEGFLIYPNPSEPNYWQQYRTLLSEAQGQIEGADFRISRMAELPGGWIDQENSQLREYSARIARVRNRMEN